MVKIGSGRIPPQSKTESVVPKESTTVDTHEAQTLSQQVQNKPDLSEHLKGRRRAEKQNSGLMRRLAINNTISNPKDSPPSLNHGEPKIQTGAQTTVSKLKGKFENQAQEVQNTKPDQIQKGAQTTVRNLKAKFENQAQEVQNTKPGQIQKGAQTTVRNLKTKFENQAQEVQNTKPGQIQKGAQTPAKELKQPLETIAEPQGNKPQLMEPSTTTDGVYQQPTEMIKNRDGGVEAIKVTALGNDRFEIDGKTYSKGAFLGEGQFAKVHTLEPEQPGPQLVLKTGKVKTDIEMLKEAGSHPNVARFVGSTKVDGKDALIMEKCSGGDLRKCFDNLVEMAEDSKNQLSHSEYWGTVQYLMRGTLQGLDHLEKQGIVHRDIKPANILLDDKTMQPKIADFGLAYRKGEVAEGGSQIYMDPESQFPKIWKTDIATPKGDVWAVGIMTYELVEGDQPNDLRMPIKRPYNNWQALKPSEGLKDFDLNKVSAGKHPSRVEAGRYGTQTAYTKFVNKMLSPDSDPTRAYSDPGVQRRPSASEALEDPFLTDSLINDEQAQSVLRRLLEMRSAKKPKEQ